MNVKFQVKQPQPPLYHYYYGAVCFLSLFLARRTAAHYSLHPCRAHADWIRGREHNTRPAAATAAAIEEASKRHLPRCCPLGRRSQPNARRCNCRFKKLFMFLVIVAYFVVVVAVADVVEFNLYSRPRIQRPQENKTKYLFGYVSMTHTHLHTHTTL